MTAEALMCTARGTWAIGSGSARRIAALCRGEALLLWRNPIALLNALVMPVAMVAFVSSSLSSDGAGGLGVGASIVTSPAAFTLLLVVYYNLVTALVARREERVLKRLRTGETSDAEILAGMAAPAVALAWGQILIGSIAAVTVFGWGCPPTRGLFSPRSPWEPPCSCCWRRPAPR
jgi:ABC-2 type transport system permease protein